MRRHGRPVIAGFLALGLSACVVDDGQAQAPKPQPQQQAPEMKTVQISAAEQQRLKTIMTPLLQHMNKPMPVDQVKIAVVEDPHINAANAGGGNFMVTTGLLRKASDDQLRAVMAHETAHEDLGHVAKTQALATGFEIGVILLDQVLPGSKAVAPLAGNLLLSGYTRGEETQADAHGVEILNRAGYGGKTLMANGLRWIAQTEGDSGGGFFDTHPATGDRILAVQRLP
jgi:predicted Zn-dependent protease